MARTLINKSQLENLDIVNADINASAAIATSKLADGANIILRGGTVPFTADQSMGSNKLTNLANGTNAGDAVNFSQLQAYASGLTDYKESVRAVTTAPITLANTQTIDGVSLIAGDRVLVKDQVASEDNGIYIVVSGGSWTRATDADASAEVTSGMYTYAEEGTLNGEFGWVLNTSGTITLGTTGLTFVKFNPSGGASTLDDLTDVVITSPTTGDLLQYDGADWVNISVQDIITASKITRETPSGSVNGSNPTFTLANTPVTGTEEIFLDGVLQDAGGSNDYTISGGTITFTFNPESGQKIRVNYWI